MIARIVQRWIQEDPAWNRYIDLLAGIPENY